LSPASRLSDYKEDERVYDVNDAGHRKLRKHPKGSFIYRLAGRDRQKSASYYTPQVLTQCLVKYALKELLDSGRVKRPTTSSPSPSASPPWAAPRS
jgi:type II restriction/modification system DNA methylase subunit YeeA